MKPPPPPPTPSAKPPAQAARKSWNISSGIVADSPQRVCIYGPGGIGKTTLVSLAKQAGRKILLLDLEERSAHVDVDRIGGIETFDDLRAILNDGGLWDRYDTVALDSLTRAEMMAEQWVLDNVPNDKGKKAQRLSDYGWGREQGHIYGAMSLLIGDLDNHTRAGRSIITTAHECATKVPNPMGDDFLQYQPRLLCPSSGKNSVRHRAKEWLDHLLFVCYDVAVKDGGKGLGSGSRTIYPNEMPTHWAKSHSLHHEVVYGMGDGSIWTTIFPKGN